MRTAVDTWAPPLAIAAGGVCVCAVVAWGNPTVPGGPLPVCPTKALLGIDCPGCGGMRMVYSLLHLDLPAAIHYNALGLVGLVVAALSYGVWVWNRATGASVRQWYETRYAARIALVLVVGWVIVRNVPYPPFTRLYV